MIKHHWVFGWLMVMAVALAGCGGATPTPTSTAATATTAPTAAVATEAPPPTVAPTLSPAPTATVTTTPAPTPDDAVPTIPWEADGVIEEGEYRQQADFDGMRVWWNNDETHLYLAMEADTTGWVAVGLAPQQGMAGANYLFGYVEQGEAQIWDAYGTAPTGANHPPDTDLGGTDDIVAFVGVEEAGVTRFEVQVLLDSGDDYDATLEPGMTYPFIVAMGDADAYNAPHTMYDRGELLLVAYR